MKFFANIQSFLEDRYGATTGLDVRDFVRVHPNLKDLGKLLVEQPEGSDDINIALLLDRDVFAAFSNDATAATEGDHRALAVTFEEVSHFVYLGFNHNRGRNVTSLELELQSEVDRVLLAFHSGLAPREADRRAILDELLNKSYPDERYETARAAAARFIATLCDQVSGPDPLAWTEGEFRKLRRFFHSDLSEKLHLARRSS